MTSAVLSSPAVERVRAALARAGLQPGIVELPGAARTAVAAAEFLGCEVAQVEENLKAIDVIPKLTPQVLERIDASIARLAD